MSVFPSRPLIVRAGAGRSIAGPTGRPMIVKADGDATAGAYALIEYSHGAGAPGPPVHVHRDHEEAFYVLEGSLTLLIAEETTTLHAGDFAVVHRGVPHSPRNDGAVPVRFFFITSPPMDAFFVAMDELLTQTGGRPSATQLRRIGEQHDSHFLNLPSDGAVLLHNETD